MAGQAAADQVAMVQSSRLPQLVWSMFLGERGERERLLKRLYPQMALMGSRMIRRGLGKLHWPQLVSRVCLFATEMSLEYQNLVKEDSQRPDQDRSLAASSSEPPSHQPVPPAQQGVSGEGAEPIPEAWITAGGLQTSQRYTLVNDLDGGGKGPANLRNSNCLRLEAYSRRKSTPIAYQLGFPLEQVVTCHVDTTGQWDRPVVMWVSRKGEDCGQAGFKYTRFLECKAKGVELASFLTTWFYDFGHQNTSRDGTIMLPICAEDFSEVAWVESTERWLYTPQSDKYYNCWTMTQLLREVQLDLKDLDSRAKAGYQDEDFIYGRRKQAEEKRVREGAAKENGSPRGVRRPTNRRRSQTQPQSKLVLPPRCLNRVVRAELVV
ncbi:MAG: hypothetical protein SGPRY_012152 [Prymnesium sp.]